MILPEECVQSLDSAGAFVIVNGFRCGPFSYSYLSRTSLDHSVPLYLYPNTYNSNAHDTLITHVYIKHARYKCGVEGRHLNGRDTPIGKTSTGDSFQSFHIEINTFSAHDLDTGSRGVKW